MSKKLLNKIRSLIFRYVHFAIKRRNALSGEQVWCPVGNIVEEHEFGEQKEIRRGTRHFRPGTKVYCVSSFRGYFGYKVAVIGKPRHQSRMICVIVRTELIQNWRAQAVHSPTILRKLREGWHDRDGTWNELAAKARVEIFQKMAKHQ